MRNANGLYCLILATGLATGMWATANWAWAAPPKGIAWSTTENEGLSKSAQSGTPMLVYFTADYCGYCKKLDRDVWSQSAVITQVSEKFIPVKINASQDSKTPGARKITGYPTILVLSPEGKEVDRIVGYSNASGIQSKLNAALGKLPKPASQPVVMQ